MTNIAYVLGFNGLTFNTQTRQYQPTSNTSSILKSKNIHVNKILPTLQNRLARLCKNPPRFDVKPESNDTEDKEAARLALQVLMAKWDQLGVNPKRIPLYMWVQECGHAYVKVSWDDTEGNPMPNVEDGSFAGYEGDVKLEVVSPFEIFPDPMAKSFEEVKKTWLIQAKVRKLDYFKAHYPEKGEQVKEEGAWLLSVQHEQRINSMNTRGTSTGSQTTLKNSAIELIKYEARSAKYPNGRMIVCANGILLVDKELPCGEIPFAKFDDMVIGGKYYSEPVVTHLRPIQDQYNETIRRRSNWVSKLLNGKYVAPRGGGLKEEALNDQSGEVVYFTPIPNAPNGGAPTALQIPMIPQWAYTEEEQLTKMFNDISGISEVSRGNMPSASIPAIGMQLLTEQDDTRIGIITEQHEHSWARVGSLILKYVEKYYVTPRKIKLAGKSLEYTVKDIQGDQLNGNTDVTVIRGSTLPGSKTLKRQEIINSWQQGLLGPPTDPKVIENVLGMIEFGDTQGIWLDYGIDMNQVKRVISLLEQGTAVNVSEFDNHTLWAQELNRYRKGEKFDKLPPEIQSLFMDTIEECINNVVKLSGMAPPLDAMVPQPPMEGEPLPPEQMGGIQ